MNINISNFKNANYFFDNIEFNDEYFSLSLIEKRDYEPPKNLKTPMKWSEQLHKNRDDFIKFQLNDDFKQTTCRAVFDYCLKIQIKNEIIYTFVFLIVDYKEKSKVQSV